MEGNGAAPNAELRAILDQLLEPVEQLKVALADSTSETAATTTPQIKEPGAAERHPARGEDVLATIAIPSADAANGGHANAAVSTLERCTTCGGRGSVKGTDEQCTSCRGSGRIAKTRVLSVQFPAGIENGAQLRVTGEGNESTNGGDPGDLFLSVMLVPKQRKRRFPFASS